MTAADKQLEARAGAVPGDAVPPGAGEADRLASAARTSSTTATAPARGSSPTSSGRGPATPAECYANEVTVPLVIGKTVDAANETLARAAARQRVDRRPDEAGQASGLRRQAGAAEWIPLGERHRAPLRHATRPPLRACSRTSSGRASRPPGRGSGRSRPGRRSPTTRGRQGPCSSRSREPGVAAGRGLKVTLRRRPRTPISTPSASRYDVAPGQLDRLRDPDPRRRRRPRPRARAARARTAARGRAARRPLR